MDSPSHNGIVFGHILQHISQYQHKSGQEGDIDLKTKDSSSKTAVAGPVGFEPTTFSLEGWRAIRAAPRTRDGDFNK